jgi:hypothetical protein
VLATLIDIDIEGEINSAWSVATSSKLVSVEMGAQRTGEVVKTRLPQHRIVEQQGTSEMAAEGFALLSEFAIVVRFPAK